MTIPVRRPIIIAPPRARYAPSSWSTTTYDVVTSVRVPSPVPASRASRCVAGNRNRNRNRARMNVTRTAHTDAARDDDDA
jgi:hypothetical protein